MKEISKNKTKNVYILTTQALGSNQNVFSQMKTYLRKFLKFFHQCLNILYKLLKVPCFFYYTVAQTG